MVIPTIGRTLANTRMQFRVLDSAILHASPENSAPIAPSPGLADSENAMPRYDGVLRQRSAWRLRAVLGVYILLAPQVP